MMPMSAHPGGSCFCLCMSTCTVPCDTVRALPDWMWLCMLWALAQIVCAYRPSS